ncbi:acyl-CoA thioesterase [Candidatus Microgenomates bacterium]|nr:acyl-CoA thioesterase [Candidatus Microgenomates bacterium]
MAQETPTPSNPIQRVEVTAGSELVDQYGHVNYKNYLKLFEPGQDDYMNRRGIGFAQVEETMGLRSIVRAINIEFLGQFFADETAIVETSVGKIGTTSYGLHQTMLKEGQPISKMDMTIVLMDANDQKTPIPDQLKAKLLEPYDGELETAK